MNESLSVYEQAYDEGYDAFLTGRTDHLGNPYDYDMDSKRHMGWSEGYVDAESDNPEDE